MNALADFVAVVGTEGPVSVRGNQTRWRAGGDLTPGTREVAAPAGIVEYVPEEMTVAVRAGTTVAELHAELAAHGQRTALPDRDGTVGGALCVGENDLEVLGKGRVRAALLRVTYVSAEGELVTGGGPTVKNVTGFDLPRLMVGSLGTLGCLAEVTLRTNPIPKQRLWVAAPDADPFAVPERLQAPSAVLWDGTTTWVLLEGHPPDVDRQVEALAPIGSFRETTGPPEDLPSHRWSLTPSELRKAHDLFPDRFIASVGVGTVHASVPQPRSPLPPAVRQVAHRMKAVFDPTGRLNPGRCPGGR